MIEESMETLLAGFGKVSPDTVPDGEDPPYIVYSTSRTPGNYVDNSAPLDRVRFTVDVHHNSRKESRTLANSIIAGLQAATFGGYVIGDQDIYEPVVKLFRTVIDFEVFA